MDEKSHKNIELHNRLLYAVIVLLVALLLFVALNNRGVYQQTVLQCPVCNESPQQGSCPNSTEVVTLLVCQNGKVVGSPNMCEPYSGMLDYEPVLTNEQGTLISKVEVKPACINGKIGGSIYYEVEAPSNIVAYELKEPGSEYEDIIVTDGLFHTYKYFMICTERCPYTGDFRLQANHTYVLRLRFERPLNNRTEYSNEHFINLLPGSEYMSKWCS
ncbi:hypothetical protein KY320_00280 [Candidatus Woesearchaeota archaeon]|nr:hypothetical protein [Candidatus Woesearchaeota archaeon]